MPTLGFKYSIHAQIGDTNTYFKQGLVAHSVSYTGSFTKSSCSSYTTIMEHL